MLCGATCTHADLPWSKEPVRRAAHTTSTSQTPDRTLFLDAALRSPAQGHADQNRSIMKNQLSQWGKGRRREGGGRGEAPAHTGVLRGAWTEPRRVLPEAPPVALGAVNHIQTLSCLRNQLHRLFPLTCGRAVSLQLHMLNVKNDKVKTTFSSTETTSWH